MDSMFSFSEKATRSTYWGITLLVLVASVITVIIAFAMMPVNFVLGFLVLFTAFIALAWIQLAVIVRRCRDADMHPMWTVGCFVPYLGFIIWIVLGCIPSKES